MNVPFVSGPPAETTTAPPVQAKSFTTITAANSFATIKSITTITAANSFATAPSRRPLQIPASSINHGAPSNSPPLGNAPTGEADTNHSPTNASVACGTPSAVPVYSCDGDDELELHPSLDDSWLDPPDVDDGGPHPLVPGSLQAIFHGVSYPDSLFLQVLKAKRLDCASDLRTLWKLVLSDSGNYVSAVMRSPCALAMHAIIEVTKHTVKIIGRRKSKKKNGSRATDVTGPTPRGRPAQHPGEDFEVRSNQLFCTNCNENIGSGNQSITIHKASKKHKGSKEDTAKKKHNAVEMKKAIEDFQEEVEEEQDGAQVCGLVGVPEGTQIFRAEALEQFISAGIEVQKLGTLRPWLEKNCGHRLTQTSKLMSVYLRPLNSRKRQEGEQL